MVSGNTVVQRNFIFFTFKKSRLTPAKLVHLPCKRILPKNLFSMAVSPTREALGIAKTHGAN
jgi:hypothetical protein